jgi:uncharacterized membrane protein (UPF0136 family)
MLARRLLLALWAGMLLTVGGLVAPLLFRSLPDRHLAGVVAGECFRATTYLSILIALGLLWLTRRGPVAGVRWVLSSTGPAWLLVASELGVRPMLEAARALHGPSGGAFLAWHGVSTLLYAAATVWVVSALVQTLRR